MLNRFSLACLVCLSLTGCGLRHKLPEPTAYQAPHAVVSPIHPVEGTKTLEAEVRGELRAGRIASAGVSAIGIAAAVSLLALGLRSFAAMAGAGALGAGAVYAACLLVTFTLPWLPLVAAAGLMAAITFVAIWAARHRSQIAAEFAHHLGTDAVAKLSDQAKAMFDKVKPLV